jgi:hypothetical protein
LIPISFLFLKKCLASYRGHRPMVEVVEKNLRELPAEVNYDNLEYVQEKRLDMYMPDNFLEAL